MKRYSRITGTGSHLPPRRVTNADLVADLAARGIETSDDWIVARTGIRARHFAAPEVACSDMALDAANDQAAGERAAPAVLDGVADFIYRSGFADDAEVDALVAIL